MNKKNHKLPLPTGNPWKPSEKDPATIPVPLHAVWDELGVKPIHELPVAKINQVFRKYGGRHDVTWIWESARRLSRTIAEWIETFGDDRFDKGISALFAAILSKDARTQGILRFSFPAPLIPILKEPYRFARLRVHFLIGLSGKYAVTLYELLESVANKVNPTLDVQLDTLRLWLKVPEGKLKSWDHLYSRALYPAIEQINANSLGAGFTVDMQAIKKGRAVDRVRFHVKKVDQRLAIEEAMQDSPSPNMAYQRLEYTGQLFNSVHLSTTDYEKAAAAAPGWDVYQLESEWREWIATKKHPEKPGAAFIAFCRKKNQREGRP